MLSNPLKGSWEEVRRELQIHDKELAGQQVELFILGVKRIFSIAPEKPKQKPKTVADFLGKYIGCVKGKKITHSEKSGNEFADYLLQKHREGSL